MEYCGLVLYSLDLFIAWSFSAFTIYSAYDLCVHLPFSPLITLGLELTSLILSWSIIYIPKLIKSKIYANNIQKKLSKVDRPKSFTPVYGGDTARIGTRENISNFSSRSSFFDYKSFSTIPRHSNSTNIGSNNSKIQGSDLESNPSSSVPTNIPDNGLTIKEHDDSGIDQDIPESVPPNTNAFNSYKKNRRNANNWTILTHNYKTLTNKTFLSKDNLSSKLSILSDLNLWIKMNILFPLVNSSVWAIADILITVIWCLMWQWAASYMKRKRGDVSLLTWKFDDVPKFYWHMEAGFHCSAVFHYCIMIYYSNNKFKRIISFNGIIELITTPCVSFVLGIIYKTGPKQDENERYLWLMLGGSIRCLRLLRTESLIYRSFYWLTEVKVIMVGVITDFLSLLLAFTSILFLLESNTHSNLFERPFDFFYLGVVTIGTVGYGDFAPITTVGRIIVIVVIFTSITMGSIQLKRLKDAMGSIGRSIGVLPAASDKYVVYWGPLLPSQLLAICRSLESSYEGYISVVVVITNVPIEDYKDVCLAINKNSDIKICITGGSSKLATPSCVADILLHSKMAVVVNELSVLQDDLLGHDDSIITIGDQDAILRLASLLRYTTQLKIPLAIQISSDYYNSHLSSMNFDRVVCILGLTNAFLAKSVTCKGLFYLILSLYIIPHDMDRAKSYVEYCSNCMFALCDTNGQDPNTKSDDLGTKMFSVLKGMQYQFFRLPFPPCMKGVKFADLVRILHAYNGSVLIGVIQKDGSGFLCPWNYIIGQELDYQNDAFYGVVIARSIEEIVDMALLQSLPTDYVHLDDNNDQIDSIPQTTMLETVKETNNHSNEVDIDNKTEYNNEFSDYNEAVRYFKNDDPFIIICGWPLSLDGFLSHLLRSSLNVIILAPIKRELPRNMLPRVAYIKGSGFIAENLINAGLFECYSLVILCCNHFTSVQTSAYNNYYNSKNERSSILMSYDHQSIFIRNLACQILERKKDKIDLSSMKLIDKEHCHVITEINQASSVEFFDVTFSTSVAALSSLGVAQKIWDNSSEFFLSLQVTTGTVFVKEMLYGLLAHSTSVCQYAIDPNYIYTLLGINIWENRGNRQSFIMEQHIKNGMTNGYISLVKLPKIMIGKSFRNLFTYMLFNKQSICIGIHRSYSIKSKKFYNGIIIAYPQNLTMQKQDEIYIINSRTQDYLF